MIDAADFVTAARRHGYGLWTGVPCSYLQPFINYVIASDLVRYIVAANEGDAVAIAAGAELGGIRSIALLQNSGLGNAVSPLTSLNHVYRLPILLIVTLRGEPCGPPDEPQHALMGAITTRMLETMAIPWEYFPTEADAIVPCLKRIDAHFALAGRPYALVMRKDSVRPWPAPAPAMAMPTGQPPASPQPAAARYPRHEFLLALQRHAGTSDLLIATTGYTGRELYALDDRPNQFYMVGSMGCASSFGLGLAITQPRRRVIVLDGDGAALMRLGALAAIGRALPPNLVHIIFGNGIHESTGGQAVAQPAADFAAIATALGYLMAGYAATPEDLMTQLSTPCDGPRLIQVPIAHGTLPDLPRPSVSPEQVAARLRAHLAATGSL
jgi:phosphonopyruvate decarboxylase